MIENGYAKVGCVRGGRAPWGGALGLVLAMGFGCEGQADPSYRGEPLLTVDGRVEASRTIA